MPITTPPTISTAPLPGPARGQKATFSTRLDAFVTWVTNAPQQFVDMAQNVYSNALQTFSYASTAQLAASDAASSAAAAAASSTAVRWDAITAYADGAAVWSPLSRLPYRRIGAGSGGLDPSLNGAPWAIQLLGIGLGGLSLTGNVALTSTSPGAVSVTPSSPGLYAILPDATSCVTSVGRFAIFNTGDFDYGIKDYSGRQIGWIRAGAGATFGLADSTSPAGVWVSTGIEKTGITASINAAGVLSDALNYSLVALDSSRNFILFGYAGATGGGIYGVVYDSASLAWGAPALIRANSSGLSAHAVLSAPNQILVPSIDGVAMEAVTIAVSGTAIAVNSGTKATATLGGSVRKGNFIPVGTSWVLSYGQLLTSVGSYVRAISVSGTMPVIGAAVLLNAGDNSAPAEIFASASIARIVFMAASSTLTCRPYTVSGVTLTPGTSATGSSAAIDASQAPSSFWKAFLNGNGNIVVALQSTNSGGSITIFKLTGTVEAGSFLTGAFATYPAPSSFALATIIELTASKCLIAAPGGDGKIHVNIATDSAGTVSAGTELAHSLGAISIAKVGLVGSVARIAVRTATIVLQLSYDCSGASPALIATWSTNSDVSLPVDGRRLTAGGQVYGVGEPGRGWDSCFNALSCRLSKPLNIGLATGINGAANELWGLASLPSIGSTIHRIEAAQ